MRDILLNFAILFLLCLSISAIRSPKYFKKGANFFNDATSDEYQEKFEVTNLNIS